MLTILLVFFDLRVLILLSLLAKLALVGLLEK